MKLIVIALLFNFIIFCWPKVDIKGRIVFGTCSILKHISDTKYYPPPPIRPHLSSRVKKKNN